MFKKFLKALYHYYLISKSGLFDNKYYLETYPDVRKADIDPLWHFIRWGWKEKRNPSIKFNTKFYNEYYPDVKVSNINPFIHYIKFGNDEGRTTLENRSTSNNFSILSLPDIKYISEAETILATLSKKVSSNPQVSIIIPVYNHIEYTINCLSSIAKASDTTKFEIIIVDDASTDQTESILAECNCINYIRNSSNLGFIHNCNLGAASSKGEYLLFLNNDTIVFDNWLDAMFETFFEFTDAGLVGSKLLYMDGKLQEAGCVIWNDGTGLNYGRYDDPNKPKYNYLREVDYCSGACIMIRKDLWNELGGFDKSFSPAYYEDTDLAFRVREHEYQVLYQPLSQIIHHEGISSGTNVNYGIKQYQKINQKKFVSKWKDILETHEYPYKNPEYQYRTRSRKKHALIIDSCTPTPDQDSGSIDAYFLMRTIRDLGYEVSFIPDNLSHAGKYTTDLQKIGVECHYLPYISSVESYIEDKGKRFDLIILSRYPVAYKLINITRKFGKNAKIIFNTVDLHFLREERKAALTNNKADMNLAKAHRKQELSVMEKVDLTILVSEFEQKYLHGLSSDIKTAVLPLPREIPGRSEGYESRCDILFLGGFRHLPNIDAVKYFISEIWPLVAKQLPRCNFLIAGSNITEEIKQLASERIKVLGFVENLADVFNTCKLSIAPLRYGAGVKGKVISSLSFGVPCVASPIAIEGSGLKIGQDVLVGETPSEFTQAIVNIYSSEELWDSLSQNGLDAVTKKYSLPAFKKNVYSLLSSI